MTTLAWGMTIVGFGGLIVLCFRAPERDSLTAKLLFGFLVIALCGVGLFIYDTPYEPIPKRAATIAPIAGAPLVRIHAAHALVAEPVQRRLPIATSEGVIP